MIRLRHPELTEGHPELVSGSLVNEIPKQVRNDKKVVNK